MKEFKIKLFKFDELSEKVRKSLIEKERWDLGDRAMAYNSDDRQGTLNAFEKVFGVHLEYQVNYCGHWCHLNFDDDAIFSGYKNGEYFEILAEEVSGKLLLRYLNSKFLDLHYPKKSWGKYKMGENGKYHAKTRRSKILWEDCCPLTGVCYDEDILNPIREYLKKPDMNLTLKDLLEECADKFILEWHKEWEYCCDNEKFLEEEFENAHEDDLYFKDGTIFQGILEGDA